MFLVSLVGRDEWYKRDNCDECGIGLEAVGGHAASLDEQVGAQINCLEVRALVNFVLRQPPVPSLWAPATPSHRPMSVCLSAMACLTEWIDVFMVTPTWLMNVTAQ